MVMLRKPLGSTADAVRTGPHAQGAELLPRTSRSSSRTTTPTAAKRRSPTPRRRCRRTRTSTCSSAPATTRRSPRGRRPRLASRLHSRPGGKKIDLPEHRRLQGGADPRQERRLRGQHALHAADLRHRHAGAARHRRPSKKMPQDVITPNIPMVTPKGEKIFGLKTQTPDDWWAYTFGPPLMKPDGQPEPRRAAASGAGHGHAINLLTAPFLARAARGGARRRRPPGPARLPDDEHRQRAAETARSSAWSPSARRWSC